MKNLLKKSILITTISVAAFGIPTAQEKFLKADVNKDGILSSTEFYNDQARKMELKMEQGKALKGAATAPHFENVDKNNDGKITFKEYDTFHEKRQKEMVEIRNKGMGSNGGKGKGLEVFHKYDKDKNGCIDKNEFRDLYNDIRNNKGKNYGQ